MMYWALVKMRPLRKEISYWSPPAHSAHGTKEKMTSLETAQLTARAQADTAVLALLT